MISDFPAILDACRRGIDTAVVVSVDEWRKLKGEERPTWKDVLFGTGRSSIFPFRSVPQEGGVNQ